MIVLIYVQNHFRIFGVSNSKKWRKCLTYKSVKFCKLLFAILYDINIKYERYIRVTFYSKVTELKKSIGCETHNRFISIRTIVTRNPCEIMSAYSFCLVYPTRISFRHFISNTINEPRGVIGR